MMHRKDLKTARDYLRVYPRLVSHVICELLGYPTVTGAAFMVHDAHYRQPNFSEGVQAVYGGDANRLVSDAFHHRHQHTGYMAEYRLARALVDRAIETGEEPMLGSWF